MSTRRRFVSSEAQWTHEIKTYPNAWPAHNNLGNAYTDAGRIADAGEQYREALAINPGYPEAHNNLGIVYARTWAHANERPWLNFNWPSHYCPVPGKCQGQPGAACRSGMKHASVREIIVSRRHRGGTVQGAEVADAVPSGGKVKRKTKAWRSRR